jgi:hypothetical protein
MLVMESVLVTRAYDTQVQDPTAPSHTVQVVPPTLTLLATMLPAGSPPVPTQSSQIIISHPLLPLPDVEQALGPNQMSYDPFHTPVLNGVMVQLVGRQVMELTVAGIPLLLVAVPQWQPR